MQSASFFLLIFFILLSYIIRKVLNKANTQNQRQSSHVQQLPFAMPPFVEEMVDRRHVNQPSSAQAPWPMAEQGESSYDTYCDEFQRYYYTAKERGIELNPWEMPPERVPWDL